MIIIMWAHICIVLHNHIIYIEGDNFDNNRERVAGLDGTNCDTDEKDASGDMLEQAQQ